MEKLLALLALLIIITSCGRTVYRLPQEAESEPAWKQVDTGFQLNLYYERNAYLEYLRTLDAPYSVVTCVKLGLESAYRRCYLKSPAKATRCYLSPKALTKLVRGCYNE